MSGAAGQERRASIVLLTLCLLAAAGLVALAVLDHLNEATAALVVLAGTVLWTRFDAAAKERRIRATLTREIGRNLDDALPMLRKLRERFAENVVRRLDAGETLYFAFSPDEDISLKIFGPMIPSLDPELARAVMAYFDAEKAACDLLLRIEAERFLTLSRPRQMEWLQGIEAILDEAIAAGERALRAIHHPVPA